MRPQNARSSAHPRDTLGIPLTPGTRLGPYEVLSALGVGGMREVYRARDTTLNRDVAIKVLLPAVANDPDRLARGRTAVWLKPDTTDGLR